MGYNGWRNYETWLVNLWLSNDRGTYEYMVEIAEEVKEDEYPGLRMADILKEDVENGMPSLDGMYGDLLSSAIDAVDFDEIGKTFMEEYLRNY